jgi:hypothetical protein
MADHALGMDEEVRRRTALAVRRRPQAFGLHMIILWIANIPVKVSIIFTPENRKQAVKDEYKVR